MSQKNQAVSGNTTTLVFSEVGRREVCIVESSTGLALIAGKK